MSPDPRFCDACESFSLTAFCSMTENGKSTLKLEKNILKFSKGHRIFEEGDEPSGIYCISEGLVKLERVSKTGGLRLLNVLKTGDLLGSRTLFSNSKYNMSAVAEEDTKVCFVRKDIILSLIEKEPSLALKLLSEISREAKRSDDRLYQSTEVSAAGRVASTLIFLKENFRSKKWTRAEIAAWAGTTPETVIRTITQFEKDGLIELSGHRIEIKNKPELEALYKI